MSRDRCTRRVPFIKLYWVWYGIVCLPYAAPRWTQDGHNGFRLWEQPMHTCRSLVRRLRWHAYVSPSVRTPSVVTPWRWGFAVRRRRAQGHDDGRCRPPCRRYDRGARCSLNLPQKYASNVYQCLHGRVAVCTISTPHDSGRPALCFSPVRGGGVTQKNSVQCCSDAV